MNERFEQIKKRYILSFQAKQEDLELAWEERNIEELLHLLHKLEGSSGGYGYPRISQTCKVIKEHLTSKNAYQQETVKGFLDSIFADFQAELNKL